MVRASLPNPSDKRPARIIESEGELVVRFYPEDGGEPKSFPFRRLGLAPEIEAAVVFGFEAATGPTGSRRTLESAMSLYSGARTFARSLGESRRPPTKLDQLSPAHIAPFRLQHTRYTNSLLQMLRTLFRSVNDVPAEFREALFAPLGPARQTTAATAYSDFEFRQIQRAARKEVRAALVRVRQLEREVAAAVLEGHGSEPGSREQLLRLVAESGDATERAALASRSKARWLAREQSYEILRALFPSFSEVTALAVLLACATGHNFGTVRELRSDHTRADDQVDEAPLVHTRAIKPRRGRYDAAMDLALTSSHPFVNGRDDFSSPAGLYRIAFELCGRARTVIGSSHLLVCLSVVPNNHVPGGPRLRPLGRGALQQWRPRGKDGHDLGAIDSRRLRRTFVEQHQRPVAHSARTLADHYLARNASALPVYQAVVSQALDREVERIQHANVVRALDDADLRAAAEDPVSAAKRLGIPVEQFKMLVQGRLDTVATACVDHLSSPYSPSGEACKASFLLCLGCPNALSAPRHVKTQAALYEALYARQAELPAEVWGARFGTAADQLRDLLDRQQVDLAAAMADVTEADRQLVNQLLDGKLDLL